jgi:Flp pilus assembly protein TadG
MDGMAAAGGLNGSDKGESPMDMQRSRHACGAQCGAMSIEFAFIFPALFLIFYAIITYGLIFAAQHTLALAAAEGGRAALRYQQAGDAAAALALRTAAARDAASAPLSWLNGVAGTAVSVTPTSAPCSYAATMTCIKVRVTYNYAASPLVPKLLGELLALPTPAALSSEATVQINPAHML